jgi:pimeloyl-ACP methyl ester carboxylesterase
MDHNSIGEIARTERASEDNLMARFSDEIKNKKNHEEMVLPLETIHIKKNENNVAPVLMIMLPGFGNTIEEFISNGFVRIVEESNLGVDMMLVNAHFGYNQNRCVEDRLHEDVLLKAKESGYQKIWLIGISMGAVGSLIYMSQHPDMIDGVFLLSPFLGQPHLIDEIVSVGGLKKWEPKEKIDPKKDALRAVLHWLKNYAGRDELPKLFLGYGREDIFYDSYQLLSAVVEKEKLLIIEGGHDWKTWQNLFWCFIHSADPFTDQSGMAFQAKRQRIRGAIGTTHEHLKQLIALGASVAVNCRPCQDHYATNALELGIGQNEIEEAVEIAKRIRTGAANNMDQYAFNRLNKAISHDMSAP